MAIERQILSKHLMLAGLERRIGIDVKECLFNIND